MTRTPDVRLQSTTQLRNLGIIAHVDAGKTTLTERILFYTGSIHRTGEVHDGNTVTDFDPSEQNHGITINAACVSCDWRDHRIQLIDTPGHVDFTLEVERSLRVLDGAVVVLDAVAGVEPQTETVWRQADRYGVPRIVFVNKLDRAGADFEGARRAVEARFDVFTAVVVAPIEGDATSLLDVAGGKLLTWSAPGEFAIRAVPETLRTEAARRRSELVELCTDLDDPSSRLRDAHAGEPHWTLDDAELLAGLRRLTLAGFVVPVLGGSAYKHLGIEPLLDAVVAYLPDPGERGAVCAADGAERLPQADEPMSALCFKIVHDSFGRHAYVRVYSGTLSKGDSVWLSGRQKRARVGRLLRVFAGRHESVDVLAAGEIGAVVGLDVAAGETLADPDSRIAFESVTVPPPVVRLSLEPVRREDHERLGVALGKLTSADPSLRLESDDETGLPVLAGLGELHLAIAIERLERDHRVRVKAGRPTVAYREALTSTVEHAFKLSKQTGGPGQYAHVVLRIAPGSEGSGLVFEDALRGNDIPRQFVSAIRAGVASAMERGVLRGSPIVDACVTLLGGSAHSNDSNEQAFHTAAARAFREAAALADPVVLEPVMRVQVTVGPDSVGTVVGGLGSRRGQIEQVDPSGTVVARVPLAELFGYAGDLRSQTKGRGEFTMGLAGYEAVPASVGSALSRASA